MKRIVLAGLFAVLVGGCASIQSVTDTAPDVAKSKTTFAVCKTLDVATTMYALNTHRFVEANPILKSFIGPGNFFPLIAYSVALYYLVDRLNHPSVTLAGNAITCGQVAQNVLVLVR